MIPAGTKVYFAVAPADLRRSFDGLAALAAGELQKNPAEGGLFVFVNKRGNQIRVLFRDTHGYCILAKRLDKGRFRKPRLEQGRFCWEMEATALMALLDDVDLTGTRRASNAGRKRHLELVTDKHRR